MMNRRGFLRTGLAATTLTVAMPRAGRAQPMSLAFGSTTGAVGLVTQVVRRLELERKYDVKLDIKILDPAAAEKAVLLRQVDAGVFPVLTAADVRDKGQDIVVFAPLLNIHIHLMVWNDSPAQSFADLRGKRIGILDKVSGAYRGMQVLAARAGLDFERDFQPVTGPPPALVTFLQRKQVDALAIHEPIVSKLLAEGTFRIVMALNEEWKKAGKGDWIFVGAGAHRDWLTKNRPGAKRLADMLLDAQRELSRRADLIEAEAEFLGLKTKAEIELARQRLPRIFPTEWNDGAVASALEPVREAARLGQIKQVPAQELLTVLR
jgi:ABC-type nitrate/sulfonate/bicarbonate transport system substrate-binding protein